MKKTVLATVLLAAFVPAFADAAGVSGWIPYWAAADGIKEARKNMEVLDTIHPFGYSIKDDGSLSDLFGMNKSATKKLIKDAKKEKVEIIPTIMSSNTTAIYNILSNPESRKKHIKEIVGVVKKGKFDGIDIDYEGKSAETKDYFSAFLTELKKELGSKMLTCTIEARTPPDSLYTVIPSDLRYANDFAVIGKVCDRVQFMTYDQQRADIKLNEANSGTPYMPISDPKWVEKVIKLAVTSIPKEKIVLGIATYGFEYEVQASTNRIGTYTRQWSVTHEYAHDFAEEIDIEPMRNSAGEMSYSYFPDNSPYKKLVSRYKVPAGTPEANKAALQALAYANATGNIAIFNLVWWTDAGAIKQKLDLADKYGIEGIALFKIDGKVDQEMWDMID